jgi:hypothetical protein
VNFIPTLNPKWGCDSKADLIIWDEALMMHRQAFKVVDHTLRDLMQLDDTHAIDKIFGGKSVVFGGDFR